MGAGRWAGGRWPPLGAGFWNPKSFPLSGSPELRGTFALSKRAMSWRLQVQTRDASLPRARDAGFFFPLPSSLFPGKGRWAGHHGSSPVVSLCFLTGPLGLPGFSPAAEVEEIPDGSRRPWSPGRGLWEARPTTLQRAEVRGAAQSQRYGQGDAAQVAAAEGPGTRTGLPRPALWPRGRGSPAARFGAARTPHPPT